MTPDKYIKRLNGLYETALKVNQLVLALTILERIKTAEESIAAPKEPNHKDKA